MKQGIGAAVAIPNVGTSLPTGTQGLAMSDNAFTNGGGRRPRKYRIELTVSSGSPVVSIVGSSTVAGTAWGRLGDQLNNGSALAVGTFFFILENLGTVERVGVQLSAGAATATLAAVFENGD